MILIRYSDEKYMTNLTKIIRGIENKKLEFWNILNNNLLL